MKTANRLGIAEAIVCLLMLVPAPALSVQNAISELSLDAPNPGKIELFEYAPEDLPDRAPLVVLLHGCGQTAEAMAEESGWLTMAREHDLALLLPQQSRANNPAACFNWFSPQHAGPGGTEARSVLAAVDQMIDVHELDPEQVFITGLSAGGSMAAALLAAYPARFAGGGIIAGVAVGCAKNMVSAFSCMRSGEDGSRDELANRILNDIDYQGAWPKISIWHGDSDNVVHPRNLDALMRQWTAIHGLEQKASSVQQIGPAERRRFRDNGQSPVEIWLVQDMEHGMPISTGNCGQDGDYMQAVGLCAPRHILAFWGLAG